MADEPKDVFVMCTTYPVKDKRKHLLMMHGMGSIVGRCAKCGCKIYISSFGRGLAADPAFKSVTYVCESCATIDAPDEHVQALPGARAQLETVFGKVGTDELIAEVSGLPMKEIYRQIKAQESRD